MYYIRRVNGCPLSLIYVDGTFDPEEVMEELDRAYKAGDITPGQSRCIFLGNNMPTDDIQVSDLIEIKKHVQGIEPTIAAGQVPSFVSVIVAKTARQAVAAEIYMSLWSIEKRHSPQFHLTRSLEQAEEVLDRVLNVPEPLEDIFACMIPSPFPSYAKECA